MLPVRPKKALPAAGAFDLDASALSCSVAKPARRVTVLCTYTLSTAAGASGGYAAVRPEWRVGGRWVPDPALLSTPAPATSAGKQVSALGGTELLLPSPASSEVSVAFPLSVLDGASDFRCLGAEVGDQGHPGDLEVTAAFGVA